MGKELEFSNCGNKPTWHLLGGNEENHETRTYTMGQNQSQFRVAILDQQL
jgi:hypothetical protein